MELLTENQARTEAARIARCGRHILTSKQIAYFKARLQGKSKTEAKQIANYSHHTNTWHIEQQNKNNGALKEILEASGINGEFLTGIIKGGLGAKKRSYFAFEGRVTDEREDEDHDARHKYLKTTLELRGDLESGAVNLNLGLIAMNPEKPIEEWGKDAQVVDNPK